MKSRKQVLFALVLLTASSVWAQQFSGGSGTSNAPYQISSTVDLDRLATDVNNGTSYSGTYFVLTQDITYNTSTDAWNDATSTENNFTAIGTESQPFAGIFNGQNHTISGIRIYKDGNSSADSYQGLFGNNSGTIRNVILANARITGYQYIGGIAGNNNDTGTIDSCKVLNDVNIHSVYLSNCQKHGGISGATSGTISNCVSSVQITEVAGVTSSSNYGGITGYGRGLSNNFAYGVNISAENPTFYKAAIIGQSTVNDYTNNYYIDCSLINISTNATATTGIGRGGNNSTTDVDDGAKQVCKVTLADNFVHVAATATAITFNETNYYKIGSRFTLRHDNRTTLGYVFSDYSVTKDGTNPVQNVDINESEGVYSFDMPGNNVTVKAIYNIQLTGRGTQQDPYIILDTNHLNYLATQVNSGQNDYSGKHFKLGANITYRHSTDWDDNNSTENNYVSIGTANHKFRGNFDGDNHTISGIRIYKNGTGFGDDYDNNGGRIGIFGYILDATIENIILTDSRYTGYHFVGGIVAQMQGGKVSHCHVLSDVAIYAVNGDATDHGGVVGACNYNSGAIVEFCSSSARVTSSCTPNGNSFGGLVGGDGGNIRKNLVIGAIVDAVKYNNKNTYGAISGGVPSPGASTGTFDSNYYWGCTVGGVQNARNCGRGGVDIDGAKPCFRITCGENISTDAMTFTIPAHGNVPKTTYVFGTDQSEVWVYYNDVQHDANREAVLYVYRIDDNGDVYDTVDVTEGGSFHIWHSDISIALKGFNLVKTIEPNKWYAISSPMHDEVLNDPDEGISLYFENIANSTNLATGTYDLFRYDESNMTWENYKAGPSINPNPTNDFTTLEVGRGYIYRIGGTSNATLRYRGVENSGDIYSIVYNSRPRPIVPLDKNGGTKDANDDQIYGLNLIGNPYPHQVYYGTGINSTDLNMSFYYTLEPNGSWRIHLANENRPIGTYEAILVYASDHGLLTFTENANAPSDKNSGSSLKFTVSDGTNEDVAYAVLGTANEKGMPKIAHMEAGLPSLSIRIGGNRYAMAAIEEETTELPLHFSGKTGKYTISVEAVENADYLHLIDLQTGNDIDLLSQSTYTFTQSGNNTSAQGDRFLVKFSNSQLPAFNSLFAYQSGDQTIITGTGALQVFDVMGRQLLSTEVDSSPFSLHRSQFPATGVYILRLDGQTQKIVIKK